MKNWKFLILAVGFMILMAFKNYQEKNYTVTLPLDKWSNYVNGLEITKQQLRNSDLPAKQVTYITDSILTPIQISISQQINATLAAEAKIKDSIKPKGE